MDVYLCRRPRSSLLTRSSGLSSRPGATHYYSQQSQAQRRAGKHLWHAGYNKTVSIATMSHCHRHGGILIICVFQNRTSNFKENILRRVYPLIQNFASIIFRSFLSEVARLIGSKWFKLLLYLQTCAGIL